MKIFVSCIAFDEGKSGISDYIISVVKLLLREHQVDLLIYKSDVEVFPIRSDNLRFLGVRNYLKRPIFSMLWHLYCVPFLYSFKAYDLVFLPAGNRRLFARYPRQTVVTFHDLSQYHIPEKYDKLRMFYIKQVIPHYLKKAPHILAISENTKNDMLRHYQMDPNRIKVNYNGYDPSKLVASVTEEDIRTKYGIEHPYMLYIARIEHPGKNHLNLIKAFELLQDSACGNYDLVLAGGAWNGSEVVTTYAENSKAAERIKFLGFVPNQDLAALYRHAKLYVFPSFYEGFGIPMLEAMSCGIPVICSNRSSLPEIGGHAILSFDPDYPADIAAKIIKVLSDPHLAEVMVERGLQRASLFSWERHIQILLETVRSI